MSGSPFPTDPPVGCTCRCHRELLGANAGAPVFGGKPVVMLDDALETALACDRCFPEHYAARKKVRP